jgi:autotransporter-associated beta strand protein
MLAFQFLQPLFLSCSTRDAMAMRALQRTLLAVALVLGLSTATQASDWNFVGGGSWTDSSKWTEGIPNGADAIARFEQDTPDGTDNDFIISNVSGTLGTLVLRDTSGHANSGWQPQASGPLTFDVSSGSALINFRESMHEINVPLVLNDNLDISYTQTLGDHRANLNNPISSGAGLTTNVDVNRINPWGTGNYGRVVFNAANTFKGDLTIHSSTLQIGNGQAIPATANVEVKSPATLRVLTSETMNALSGAGLVTGLGGFPNVAITLGASNGSGSFSGTIVDGGSNVSLKKNGSGTQILSGNNTYSAGTTINQGTLQLGSGSTTGSVAGNITLAGGTLAIARSDNPAITNAITGTGNLQIVSGECRLAAASNFTGTVTIEDGARLRMGIANALNGTNDIVLNGANANLRVIHGGGEENINAGSLAGNGVVDLGGPSNKGLIVGGNNNSTTFTGTITNQYGGAGFITKIGTGSLTLGSANTYGGATTVSSGTLLLGNPTALGNGTSAIQLADASTGAQDVALLTDVWAAQALSSPFSISRNITVNNQGTGKVTLGSSAAGVASKWVEFNGTITLNKDLHLQGINVDRTTFNGTITGTGNLYIDGPRRITFAGNNTYSGDTLITAGTAQYQNGNAIPDGSNVTVNSGALLLIWDASEKINGLNGAGSVQIGNSARTLTVGTGGGNGSFSGVISNSGTGVVSLVKAGNGTQALSGANTYTGTTTLSAGTLVLGSTAALGNTTSAVQVCNADTLASDAALLIDGNLTITRPINVNNLGTGTVTLGSNSASGLPTFSGAITLGRSVQLKGVATDRTTFTGAISGSGDVIAIGPNRIFFGANNSYTGNTFINAGDLQVNSGDGIPNTSDVTVGSGASFTLAWVNEAINALKGNGTVRPHRDTNNVTLTVGASGGSGAFDGTIKNETKIMSLTKTGSGTQVLTGTNTYTGPTSVSGGTLKINGSIANSAVSVASGATLAGSGSTGTVNLSGTVAPGNSTGTLTTGGEVWNPGGSYVWEINDVDGGLGGNPGWDWLNINGTLDVAATSANPFAIDMTSLALDGAPGIVHDLDPAGVYSWTIATATGGILNFSPDKFSVLTTHFQGLTPGARFLVSLSGDQKSLLLGYSVPEPSSLVLLGLSFLAFAVVGRAGRVRRLAS